MLYLDDENPYVDDGTLNSPDEEEQVENGEMEQQQEKSKNTTSMTDAAKSAKKTKETLDKVKNSEKIAKMMKSTKVMSFVAKLGPLLPIILLVIVLIIILIGLIMFLLMMPGVLMGKLNALFEAASGKFEAFWEGTENALITDANVIEVATYLESMGYDLKEYGFLTDKVTDPVSEEYKKYAERDIDEKNAYIDSTGIGRDKDGITNIESDIIESYLASDNYVYCCRNFNKNVKTAFSSLGTFLKGFFLDSIEWGSGLIGIYHESTDTFLFWSKSKIGQQGASWANSLLSDYTIDVDAKAKTLTITTKTGILGLGRGKSFTYKLEGWTARYGMPLEFLLSVHLTSMSPDLAVDLATSFDTEVVILLHETNITIEGGIQAGSSIVGKTDFDDILNWTPGLGNDDAMELFRKTSMVSQTTGDYACTQPHGMLCSDYAKSDEYETNKKNSCDNCEKFCESVRDDLNAISSSTDIFGDLQAFKTFIPYISKVTDHWFRDVYFVAPLNMQVVTYDDDFEKQTGERWSKYETKTDADGNVSYVLYELNDDGTLKSNPYTGTQEEAEEKGIRLSKKIITKSIDELAEEGTVKEGSWFSSDYWAAYEYKQTSSDSWIKYQPSDDETDLNNIDNLYYKESIQENISQIQDAQRGPTNLKIKQIFSTNKYYVYDGTEDKADAIKKDREKTDRSKDNTSSDERNSELIDNFSVTRDSLVAFNILENMHTFDADSIYRDFKELIVELDYFDKEELAEKSQVVWEWPIPETGSGGWPVRRYEKSGQLPGAEYNKLGDFFGSLIHSKIDLDNLKEITAASIDVTATGTPEGDPTSRLIGTYGYDGFEPTEDDYMYEEGYKFDEVTEEQIKEASLAVESAKYKGAKEKDNVISNEYTNIIKGLEAMFAASGGGSGSGYQGATLLETAKNCWEYIVDSGKYSYAGASIPITGGTTVDCSAYVSWVLYEYGYDEFKGGQHCTTDFMNTDWEGKYGWEVIDVGKTDCSSQLQPGDLLVREGDGPRHHIQLIKEVEANGKILTYDCGAESHWVKANKEGYYSNFASDTSTSGKIIRIESETKYEDPYNGYSPFQDVVSPISGEIIEAGEIEIENLETGVEEKVPFIKIRALTKEDEEAYFKVDKGTRNIIETCDKDDLEKYKDYFTKLGFTYFREDYADAQVEDTILYIEGFDLKLVNESLAVLNDEDIVDEETNLPRDMYTKENYDEVYSKDAKEFLERKEEIRASADTLVKTGDGKIFVKEGAVLGKTYSDGSDAEYGDEVENLDKAKERPGIRDIPEDKKKVIIKTSEGEEEFDAPNGNYIRMILRTSADGEEAAEEKDAMIENIEDYLEIDNSKRQEMEWELFYWLPFESGGLDLPKEGPECFGSCSVGETAVGIIQWTSLNDMNNIVTQFIKGCQEKDPVLCAPLSRLKGYSPSDFYNAQQSGGGEVQAVLTEICNNDRDAFINVQMEVAKEQYLDPLLEDHPWLADRPLCVQGEVMHLKVWGAKRVSEVDAHQGDSDEQILDWVRNVIANTGSTVGPASGDESTGRAWSEPEIGKAILDGRVDQEDIETWMRQKDISVFPDGVYKGP